MKKSLRGRIAAVVAAVATTLVLFQSVALLGHPMGRAETQLAARPVSGAVH